MIHLTATDISLEVLAAPAPALVQDAGRPGHMRHGVPPGGALVPELFAAANRAVGNAWHAAALEIYGDLVLGVHGGVVWLAIDEHAWFASAGEQVVVSQSNKACVRYLAVQGGIEVPEVLGGRGTLLTAAIGGLAGRPLRRGDILHAGLQNVRTHRARRPVRLDPEGAIRIIPGPDGTRFELDAIKCLTGQTFTVSPASDRIGMRLAGPRVGRIDDDTPASTPMVRGAIQVPASGELIVLGPDHPTTGGYPVIATVIRADVGRLAARRSGAPVQFRAVTLSEARAAWRRFSAEISE